jgi:acetyl esterase
MPLDPAVRTMLDSIEAVTLKPFNEQTPAEARAGFELMNQIVGPPEKAVPTEDRTIPGPGGEIPIRIYRPEAEGPVPVVVYFHGGGWVIGNIDSHDTPCHRLAAGVPCVVVSVEYRLAPEARYPAAVEDCEAAAAWVSSHAADLGADPARLAVAGDSAGGNLAAVVARRARDKSGPPIAFQLLIYPATDLTRSMPSQVENGTGYLLTVDAMEWFEGHYLEESERKEPDASPLFVDDLAGLPPALVVTAEFDPLRDEGEAYAERLRQAGGDAVTSRYDGQIHGFYGLDSLFEGSRTATAETIAALRRALSA